jgi:hypothetical protein
MTAIGMGVVAAVVSPVMGVKLLGLIVAMLGVVWLIAKHEDAEDE